VLVRDHILHDVRLLPAFSPRSSRRLFWLCKE
jgi:hypothetical protein